MINYGMVHHGQHVIIKLRMKLSSSQRNAMRVSFPELAIMRSLKDYTLVEGCLHHERLPEFIDAKEYAMAASMVVFASKKLNAIVEQQTMRNAYAEQADLS